MSNMDGCYGEVKLAHQDSNKNNWPYKKWGIEIKVRFRAEADGGKVAVLDKRVHSGGERSVSTILFLMALQVMSRVVSVVLIVDSGNSVVPTTRYLMAFSGNSVVLAHSPPLSQYRSRQQRSVPLPVPCISRFSQMPALRKQQ